MKLTDRLKKAAGLAALPAATVLTASVMPLTAAYAQAQTPAAFLKVLTPRQNETLGTTQFNLDVQFKSLTNEPIVTAELWVDGVRWVRRDLDSPRRASVLSFLVDGSTLSAGAHNIVVKVLNADGGESSSRVSVVAGSDEGENNAEAGGPEVQFVSPGNGKKVSGNVELLVDANSHNGQNPYVTFYVDKKFKTLKNYPPYTFEWDTTNESNGLHEIEASGYLDSSNTTTTRRIRVFVDNPGGNTVRMTDIPDLSTTHKRTMAIKLVPTPGKMVARTATPAFVAPTGEAVLSSSTASTISVTDSLGLADMSAATVASSVAAPLLSAPHAPIFATAKPVEAIAVPTVGTVSKAAHASVKAAHVTPKFTSVSATPIVSGEPTLSVASEVASIHTDDTVAGLANIQFAAPAISIASPSIARPAAPSVAATVAKPARTISITPAARTTMSLSATVRAAEVVALPASFSLGAPKVVSVPKVAAPKTNEYLSHHVTLSEKPLEVAFDGQKIAFDVQPRVEAGLPIAPFRQIFEHTGGRVSWTSGTKTVHAVNADREIVIGVGKKDAVVNGTVVSMDRAATLERGRTIVPLNFVGKALDMNVQYDPATGRLSITSKN